MVAALVSGSASGGFHPGLPVTARRDFSLSGFQLVSDEGRRQLRSANSRTCVVRWTYSSYADRCFAAAGPELWNSLPAHLRQKRGFHPTQRTQRT